MMKKLCLILSAMLLLTLTACTKEEAPETTVPTVVAETMETTEAPTETTKAAELIAPEPAFGDYVYQYEDERDLAWERDIVYMAKLYLGEMVVKGHPYLVNEQTSVISADNKASLAVFYDEALREAFIQEVNALLSHIPELTDDSIVLELQRIAALLKDAHSSVNTYLTEYFPLDLVQLESEGTLGIYAIGVPAEYGDLILERLESVNGVPAEQIVDTLTGYVSTENSYHAAYCAVNLLRGELMLSKVALQTIGVMGYEEDTAVFRFVTAENEPVEIELEALDITDGESNISYTRRNWVTLGMRSYTRYGQTNYWFEYMQEQDTVYVRLHQMMEEENLRLSEFTQQIGQLIHQNGGVSKMVIDVRDNPGGLLDFIGDFLEEMENWEIGKTYVLINEGSTSAAVIFPWNVREKFENSVLVGTPAGQPVNFFANATNVELRHHDVSVTISSGFYATDTEDAGDTLMPDILIYPNLEDYKQGIDTVLETALAD